MSIKLMSAIFETEFFDMPLPPVDGEETRMAKASSVKLVLLALADHANDEGEGAYPGIKKLLRKTALSRQGLLDILSAIKYNGLATVADELSRLGTSNYTLNTGAYPRYGGQESERVAVKPLDPPSQATLPPPVKPLDLIHPLTINDPSLGDKSPLPLDWQIAANQSKLQMPDNLEAQMIDAANLIATGMGAAAKEAYDFAMAFQHTRRIVFIESQIKGQRKAVRALLEAKITPAQVAEAVIELTAKGMTITDLYSVIKTAISLAHPAPGQQNSYNPQGLKLT